MTAWYNDNDRKACAWLRQLIAEGYLPPGDVDERSILDVQPDDLVGYTQCHFFAGIGGWAVALALAGWPDDRPCWTASCPCQPLSIAGDRQGHVDERHLWPAVHRLVQVRKPAVMFGEQVASKDGREWFAAVRADMEGSGYACGCADLPAASVGAPQERQRLFWVADDLGEGSQGRLLRRQDEGRRAVDGYARRDSAALVMAGAAVGGRREGRTGAGELRGGDSSAGELGNTEGRGRGERGHASHTGRGRHTDGASDTSVGLAGTLHPERRSLDVDGEDGHHRQDSGRQEAHGELGTRREILRLDDAAGTRHIGPVEGSEADPRDQARLRLSGEGSGAGIAQRWADAHHGGWADADWLYCRDGRWRPVESGTFPLAHGVRARVGRLRGYGNAIVPQVAAEMIAAYMEISSTGSTLNG